MPTSGNYERNRRFRRPEFQKRLERARRYQRAAISAAAKKTAWLWVAGAVCLGLFYFLFISGFFLIQQAVIAENSVSAEQIEEVLQRLSRDRWFLIPKNHLIFLNRAIFLEELKRELPQIRALKAYRRILPNKIELAIEERAGAFVWQTANDYYLVDQDGVVFQEIANYSPATYQEILIIDRTGSPVKIGDVLEAANVFGFIKKVKSLWPGIINQTSYASFALPGLRSLDVFAKTGIGFEVYFDLGRDAKIQLENLNLVLTQPIKPETYAGLSYIDLRLSNIAYYCYKDSPCVPAE